MSMTGICPGVMERIFGQPDNRIRRDRDAFGRCSCKMTLHAFRYGFGGSCVVFLVQSILSDWIFDAVEYLLVDSRYIAFRKKSRFNPLILCVRWRM
jgi:hypothetical protein